MTFQGRVKLQVWLLIIVVFVLGGVTGASLDRLYRVKNDRDKLAAGSHGTPAGRPRGPGRMLEKMTSDLSLNEEQVAKIRTVFEESRKAFPPNRFAECPGFKEMRAYTRSRVREVLNPEQQKRYDEINAQRDAEMSKEH